MTSVRHSESVVVRLSEKSLMPWNRGLLQLQFDKKNCIWVCTITVCVYKYITAAAVFAVSRSATWTRNRMAGIQLDPFKEI